LTDVFILHVIRFSIYKLNDNTTSLMTVLDG